MGATVVLTLLKFGVASLSGSVGVFSEGVHSLLDLISAALAFFTIREAGKPADWDHPFGHGKFETLSSLVESLLLIVAAGWICYEGLLHFRHPQEVQYQGLAIATVSISLVLSYIIYRHNYQASIATDSSAIRVNALHFFSDVVASAGVLLGLVLLKFTGWLFLDPLLAFAVALYILLISWKQVKSALLELTDTQLPAFEVGRIHKMIDQFSDQVIEAHDLRTRKSGATRHVDFHMVVCRDMTVQESHRVCDEIEAKLGEALSNISVNIHVEPCEEPGTKCVSCKFAQKKERVLKEGSSL